MLGFAFLHPKTCIRGTRVSIIFQINSSVYFHVHERAKETSIITVGWDLSRYDYTDYLHKIIIGQYRSDIQILRKITANEIHEKLGKYNSESTCYHSIEENIIIAVTSINSKYLNNLYKNINLPVI
jgi:hypothetical protein